VEPSRSRPSATAARAVAPEDPQYPHGLDRLPGSRPVVFLRGAWERSGWRVAIVGSRRASPEGSELAYRLAAELAGEGIEILSGLAAGIDAAAHRGALSAGRTGAVLGTGFDRCYPPENLSLQEAVAGSVGLLTERPPGAPVTPGAFASRNRLLAALSDAVVVVEGHPRSGALITARHARSMFRPVGAVPWSLWSEHGAAPHELLRSGGAVLVRGPSDVLELLPGRGAWPPAELPLGDVPAPSSRGASKRRPTASKRGGSRAWVASSSSRAESSAPASIEARVLGALRESPRSLDEIAAGAGASLQETSAALLLLEIAGTIRREFGGRVRLAPRLRFSRPSRS
jgi:DNA processing protein